MRHRVRRRLAGVLAATLVCTALGTTTLPSDAQEPGADDATVDVLEPPAPLRVSLRALDSVVGTAVGRDAVTWRLLVENRGTTTFDRVEVRVDLHGPVGSRSALRTALAGAGVPAQVRTATIVLPGSLTPGSATTVTGELLLVGLRLSSDIGSIHPLRFRVSADGQVLHRIDTAVMRLSTTPVAPLTASLVWPLNLPPARTGDGGVDPAFAAALVPGATLDTLVRTLERTGGRDVTIAPAAHLLEDLDFVARSVPAEQSDLASDGTLDTGPPAMSAPNGTAVVTPTDAQRLDAQRAAVLLEAIRRLMREAKAPPVSLPYADADLSGLLAAGTLGRGLAARAALQGPSRTGTLSGRTAMPVSLLPRAVDPQVLDLLDGSIVLLPSGALVAPDSSDVPPGEPVRSLTAPSGRLLIGVTADAELTSAMGSGARGTSGDPLLAAHEVIVRSAMVFLEAPGRAGRTLLLLPPDGFDPDPRFAAALIDRAVAAPWLDLQSPVALVVASSAPREPASLRGPEPGREFPPRLTGLLTETALALELLEAALDREAIAEQGLEVILAGQPLDRAGDVLLRATSYAFRADVERAVGLLTGLRSAIDGAFGTIELNVNDITLTDRDGTLPILLRHSGGFPLQLRIEIESSAALTWPEGTVRTLTVGVDEDRALELPLRAGSSGSFPVTVRVTDTSGRRILATETLAVRATAVAGPALTGLGIVIAVLTAVGLVRQRRRGRSGSSLDDARTRSVTL